MKKCVGFFVLLLSLPVLANTSFEWQSGKSWAFSRINLNSKAYEVKELNQDWIKKFDLIFEGVDPKEIPFSTSPLAFNFQETVLFSIPGTGQVYQFEKSKKVFRRLDKTFFRGYNFHALQFVKHDTLFSLGGEGFWRSNSILSYFDFKNKEWEQIKTFGDIPNGILSLHAGIIPNQTKVIAMEAFKQGEYEVPKLGFYELDLLSHVWKKKGNVDLLELKKMGQTNANFILVGNLMFLNDPKIGLYVDVNSNQIYKYVGPKKLFFLIESELFQRGNQLFSKQRDKNSSGDHFIIDSMSISDLKKDSQVVGLFYSEESLFTPLDYVIIGVSLCLLISLGINFRLLLKKNKSSHDRGSLAMPIGGKEFIALFKLHGEDHLVSTEEISVLLGCDKKAFDTQRQYRAQFIISMNQYFNENFQIEEAVVRKAYELDKRIVKYGLKAEAFQIKGII